MVLVDSELSRVSTHPQVQQSSVLAPEPSDLVKQVLAGPTQVDPHPLAHLLHDPGHVGGVGDDAIVGDPGAGHHPAGRPAVDSHLNVESSVGAVGDLEDHAASQQVQSHGGNLRDVAVTWEESNEWADSHHLS